jgi:cytochrome c2
MTIVKPLHSLAIIAALALSAAHSAYAQGDAQRGVKFFPLCAGCHTLESGRCAWPHV